MIPVDCEQGTRKWIEARLGVITASQCKRVVTPTGKVSTQKELYLGELCAEWALGQPLNYDESYEDAERGKRLEPDARDFYEFTRNATVKQVGFVYLDDAKEVGASPDAFAGEGLWECKCPAPGRHLLWLAQGVVPKDHVPQIQMQIWVCKAPWCDFMSYCPDLPELLIRVEPCPKWQAALDEHIPAFADEVRSRKAALREMGVYGWNDDLPDPSADW